MFEEQEIVEIRREELIERVRGQREEGFRLVQIGCTKNDAFQIDYTFDRQYRFLNLRLFLPVEEARLPSITGIFPCAFTYENEIHDLFGIEVQGNPIDYRGNFYRVPLVAPFNVPGKPHGALPERKE